MSENTNNLLDLGSIDFTPEWAKKSAGVTVGKSSSFQGARTERFGERKGGGEKGAKPFTRKMQGDRPQGGGERKFRKDRREAPARAFERARPLDAEVKILPETKALGTIIRKLQQSYNAYKLKDLAYFFLDNPQSVLLKITPNAPADGSPKAVFHQCKACGFASTDEDAVVSHALNAHLCDYYDAKEIEVEPPKGNFSCVARCGMSGVYLGPPNIHEFNANVKEMLRTKFPQMSESEYRSRIEMVRDADAIEEWRKSAVKKTVFTAKGAGEDASVLTREQAEGEFRRTILPSLLDKPKNLMITADIAMASAMKPLVWAARDAIEAEKRNPRNMCFALRGAFHHRKMKFFRANDAHGPEFVTGVELKKFDVDHAIPELAALARFIAANPCCDKSEIGSDEATMKHLDWLASTGHIVAFSNGVFSEVEKFPKYGPKWKKRTTPAAEVSAPAVEVSSPVEEVPAPVEEEVKKEEVNSDETAAELA